MPRDVPKRCSILIGHCGADSWARGAKERSTQLRVSGPKVQVTSLNVAHASNCEAIGPGLCLLVVQVSRIKYGFCLLGRLRIERRTVELNSSISRRAAGER